MRKILSRGKRVDNGEWIEGYYVCLNGEEHRIYSGYAETDCGDYYPDYWTVDPDTVGQFTGVTDKYSNPVFEDHIIRDEDGDIYAVFYYEFYASYCAKRIAESSALFGLQDIDIYGAEVIGNIYDNPELLEVKYDDQP